MKIAAVLLTMALAGACAGRAAAPPAIVVDRTACSRCGMLISEPAYAAAIRRPDGRDEVFDDIGCLVAAIRQAPAGNGQFWFHDATDGKWITHANPVFVVSPDLRTPMGGGIVAHRDRADADESAARTRGHIVATFRDLIASEGTVR